MNSRHWLDRVAGELAARGLPNEVRARLMDELRDHVEDLTEGGMGMATSTEMEAQMGSPVQLATEAAEEYRRSAWVCRHRFLIFGLAPLPVAVLALALSLAAFAGIAYAADRCLAGGLEEMPLSVLRPIALAITYTLRFAPFVTVVAAFGFVGVRYRVNPWWLAAAVLEVAILGGAMTAQLQMSDVPGASQLMLGFSSALSLGWAQLFQLVAPLAAGACFLRASRRTLEVA